MHTQHPQLLSGVLVIWYQPQGLAQVRHRLVTPAKLSENSAEMVMCLRMGKDQPQGCPVLRRGLIEFALRRQHIAQVEMGIGIVQLKPDRFAKVSDCFIEPPLAARPTPRLS